MLHDYRFSIGVCTGVLYRCPVQVSCCPHARVYALHACARMSGVAQYTCKCCNQVTTSTALCYESRSVQQTRT